MLIFTTMFHPRASYCCDISHIVSLACVLPPSSAKREGVRAVIAALESSPCLRRLSLAGCQLGGDGGQAMISAIGSSREKFRLLDLDLSYNSLGAGAGEALAAAVRRNQTLTRLSLRCVRFFLLVFLIPTADADVDTRARGRQETSGHG